MERGNKPTQWPYSSKWVKNQHRFYLEGAKEERRLIRHPNYWPFGFNRVFGGVRDKINRDWGQGGKRKRNGTASRKKRMVRVVSSCIIYRGRTSVAGTVSLSDPLPIISPNLGKHWSSRPRVGVCDDCTTETFYLHFEAVSGKEVKRSTQKFDNMMICNCEKEREGKQ